MIRMFGTFSTEGYLFLVTEWAPCDFFQLMTDNFGSYRFWCNVRIYAGQVRCASARLCGARCALSGPLCEKAKVRWRVSEHKTVVESPWAHADCVCRGRREPRYQYCVVSEKGWCTRYRRSVASTVQ